VIQRALAGRTFELRERSFSSFGIFFPRAAVLIPESSSAVSVGTGPEVVAVSSVFDKMSQALTAFRANMVGKRETGTLFPWPTVIVFEFGSAIVPVRAGPEIIAVRTVFSDVL
jgi:hypothetical protein